MILHTLLFAAIAIALQPYQTEVAQQSPSISASADRNEVRIADPFAITISVKAPESTKVVFPELGEQVGPFEVLSRQDAFGIPVEGNRKLWTVKLNLETFETGELEFPAIEVATTSDLGQRERVSSGPILIRVESSIEEGSDATTFNDIRDVIDAEIELTNSTWSLGHSVGVAGIAIVLVAAGIALFAATRRQRWMTPAQWARTELEDRDGLPLSKVDSVFREFITNEFGFPAATWCEDDFEQFAIEMELPASLSKSLNDHLGNVQQQKFAGRRVSAGEVDCSLKLVLKLIETLHRKNRGEN